MAESQEARRIVEEERLPLGVWRRAPMDWAYRVEVPGRGSVYGCGFPSRKQAQEAKREASESLREVPNA